MQLQRFVMHSLRRGLLLSLAVPLFVAAGVSAFLAYDQWQKYATAEQAISLKAAISRLGALIHEQQKERGATSVFLSSGGTEFSSELAAQRLLTDQAARGYMQELEGLGSTSESPVLVELRTIADVLAERSEIRQLIDDMAIATPVALGHYTAHNAQILAAISRIGAEAKNPKLSAKVASLRALLAAKEFSGIERAIGSGGFAAGEFDFSRLRLLERLISKQSDNLARFETLAEDIFRDQVRKIDTLAETDAIRRMRDVAFSSFETGDLEGVTASDFFAATTARIDALKSVEDDLVASISKTAERISRTAFRVGVLLLCAITVAFLTSALTTRYVIRNMLASVRAISNAGDRLARGDDNAELPADSPQELGRIVWSINFFRESVIEGKQREAAILKEREATEKAAREEHEKRQREEKLRIEHDAEKARAEQEAMTAYVSEIAVIVAACTDGDFSQKLSLDGKTGVLAEIGSGLNTLVQSVQDGLGAVNAALERVANGDLTKRMEGDFRGAFRDLQANTNQMMSSLRQLVSEISESGLSLAKSSEELHETSEDLSRKAEQNATSLEETSAALDQLNASIRQVSESVVGANQDARSARETAQSSSVVASAAAGAMNKISAASREIARVVSVIDDISFQINLLALNAGVEAARAGDAGRGFSVVASEVRQLAQRASDSAKEISKVIDRSQEAVEEGVEKVSDARTSLEKISESVVGVSARIDQVSTAISEQAQGVGDINNSVNQIEQNTQLQAASFEEVTAASAFLLNEAESLRRSTSRFEIEAGQEHHTAPIRATANAAFTTQRMSPVPDGNLAIDAEDWREF
ncbi:MAG: nitrate- and nitrite sensing domain-containing protein [Pseudomonadota bacterium]